VGTRAITNAASAIAPMAPRAGADVAASQKRSVIMRRARDPFGNGLFAEQPEREADRTRRDDQQEHEQRGRDLPVGEGAMPVKPTVLAADTSQLRARLKKPPAVGAAGAGALSW
jgi:hypothetical protein